MPTKRRTRSTFITRLTAPATLGQTVPTLLAALIRPIFNAENLAAARDKLSGACAMVEGTLPKVAGMLKGAEDDILAFYAFPADHWRKLRAPTHLSASTARSAGAPTSSGSPPTTAALIRLASMLAIEQNDEWLVGRRYLSAASMGPLLEERPHRLNDEEVLELQPA
jgi:putative transposase